MLIILCLQDVEAKKKMVGSKEREIKKRAGAWQGAEVAFCALAHQYPTLKWVGECTYLRSSPHEVCAVHEVLVARTLLDQGFMSAG